MQGLMDEAEVESSRCEGETERCNQELQIDDERMEMTDEQRKALYLSRRIRLGRGVRSTRVVSRQRGPPVFRRFRQPAPSTQAQGPPTRRCARSRWSSRTGVASSRHARRNASTC